MKSEELKSFLIKHKEDTGVVIRLLRIETYKDSIHYKLETRKGTDIVKMTMIEESGFYGVIGAVLDANFNIADSINAEYKTSKEALESITKFIYNG